MCSRARMVRAGCVKRVRLRVRGAPRLLISEPLLVFWLSFRQLARRLTRAKGGGGREASAGGGRGAEEEFGAKVAVLGNVERC